MSKQDRQAVRTVQDLERKYNFGLIGKGGSGLKFIDVIHPIGSVYMSVDNVSPSVFFGGTWERIEDTNNNIPSHLVVYAWKRTA